MTFNQSCPSCAAPLDNEGICTSCGALSRGFFRGLDLGAPQVAQAVTRGLDFYRLLEVERHADVPTIARRYRRLRVLFPDDPSSLAPEPARKLELLEVAGRVLTDPALRKVYDELRTVAAPDVRAGVVRCAACGAPLPPDAPRCAFCGTPRPAEGAPPDAPPDTGPVAAEPVDFYALIGLTPMHLAAMEQESSARLTVSPFGASLPAQEALQALRMNDPPSSEDVDAASYSRQRETLLAAGITAEARETRLADLETARRILRDDRLRDRYDIFWRALRSGRFERGHFEGLRSLIDEVNAADLGNITPGAAEGEALLRQGLGLMAAGLPREALQSLRQARAALPQSAEAHLAFARATLTAGDPLDLGGHALRQVMAALDSAQQLGANFADGMALTALCRGLLARDAGDSHQAEAELHTAVRLNPALGVAWRGLAALTLARGALADAAEYCRRAINIDPRDERALLMLAGACLRARRREEAREAAAHIAALRGADVSADDILAEIGG